MANAREVWKAAVIVDGESKQDVDLMVRQLLALGLDAIHVFTSTKSKVNKQRDIIVHASPNGTTAYAVWRDALATMAAAYGSQTELFLFVRPRIRLWEQLPVYCEYTVDRSTVGVWSPFTPTRLFPDEYPETVPCSGSFGWCRTGVNRSLEANHCWVMSRHMVALLATYLPKSPEIMGANTAGIMADVLANYDFPFYFHTPSLAGHVGNELFANDFVGVSYHLGQQDMKSKNFILT